MYDNDHRYIEECEMKPEMSSIDAMEVFPEESEWNGGSEIWRRETCPACKQPSVNQTINHSTPFTKMCYLCGFPAIIDGKKVCAELEQPN